MAVGDLVDLDHRCQRAAAQAGDFLDGEQPVGVGVFTVGKPQVKLQGVLDQPRAFHVAGGAVANADDVCPHRPVPKLGVESRYAGDRGGRDPREVADAFQGLLGEEAIVLLDRLQDGDHHLRPVAQSLDGLVDEVQIEFALHSCPSTALLITACRLRSLLAADAEQVLFAADVEASVLEGGAGGAIFTQLVLGDQLHLFAARL